MAVRVVRIPTICANLTTETRPSRRAAVSAELFNPDLEGATPALLRKPPGGNRKGLRRFVNVYLNDEDVRFLGGLETRWSDGEP